jgi:hypothetical protein
VFKRFTLLVVGLYKREIRLGQKKPAPVSVDAEHDKRIAENYVFDEVQGIYVALSMKDVPDLTRMTTSQQG